MGDVKLTEKFGTWTAVYEVLIGDKAQIWRPGLYGAFVNVTARTSSAGHFRELAAAALERDGYIVLGTSDLQVTDLDDPATPQELAGLKDDTFTGPQPVIYGTFHTFPKEGLDG